MTGGYRLGKIALAIAAMGTMAQAPSGGGPRVNDVFRAEDGTRVGGWDYQGGSMWGKTPGECCIAIFSRGDALMLVLTEQTDAASSMERVRSILRVPRLKNDVELPDCTLDGRMMLLAILDRKSGMVTGYESDGKVFTTIVRKWDDVRPRCDWSDYDG